MRRVIMKYVPIGFKSDYSLLKSTLKTDDIVDYAKNAEGSYVGILEDNPYSIMDFFDKCAKNSIKAIVGMVVKFGDNKIYLYIQDYDGYLNIIKINDLIVEGKFSIDELIKYNKGLICVLPYEQYNLYNRLKSAFEIWLGYKNSQELKNAIQISKKVLFLNEVTYLKKEDAPLLKIIYKIAGCEYENGDHHVLDATDFDISTVDAFQELCNLEFDYSNRYIPQFCKTKEESRKLLYTLAKKGLAKRLGGKVDERYEKRLMYELDVIDSMGFVDYFLIVYDYVKFAKKNDIYVGPGRGSAAGALVSYTLGITDIDPIEYDLLFERFLNPDRITMPDIDLDFEDERRNEIIDYVREKYGDRRVSLIVAYGTMGCRQAVRDVGKVYDIEEKIIGQLSKQIDPKKSLRDNTKNPEVVKYIRDNKLEKIYKVAMRLEGLKKNTTIHAAGVIISSIDLNEIIPTYKSGDGILTGYTMEHLEKLGLLKMDFLALRNLTTIHNTVRLIRKVEPSFDLKNVPLDDKNTYDSIFKKVNTDNIFQFETPGMRNFLRKLQPDNFEDLIAAIALFRPGPMENIDEYIARRKGQKKIDYLHPDLEAILKNTYGIIVYQEQIMQILVTMGGYSYAEADLIRRAMSKKKKEVMIEERRKFVLQACEKGYGEKLAEQVYDLIVKFANYGFNKSHSVAYAVIAYQMAYLKANYMEQFQVNNLNMNIGSEKKTKDVIESARKKGLMIVSPNVNMSAEGYVIRDGKVILPLTSIKGITAQQSKAILDAQPFDDYFDFFKKTYQKGINRTAVELLIKSGALEDFGKSKNTLLQNIDSALTYVELVNSLDESLVAKPELEESKIEDEEYSEIDLFGFYVSGHPASKYVGNGIVKIRDFNKFLNRQIAVVVLVEKLKVIDTKKGEKMAFVQVADETGSCDAVIFPKNNIMIEKIGEGLNHFKATIGKRNDEIQLILEDILALEEKKGGN